MFVRCLRSAMSAMRRHILSVLAIASLMAMGAFVGDLLYARGCYPMSNPRSGEWKAKEYEVQYRLILVITCSLVGLACPYLGRLVMPKICAAGRLWLVEHNRSQILRIVEIVLVGVIISAFASWWLRLLTTPSAVP